MQDNESNRKEQKRLSIKADGFPMVFEKNTSIQLLRRSLSFFGQMTTYNYVSSKGIREIYSMNEPDWTFQQARSQIMRRNDEYSGKRSSGGSHRKRQILAALTFWLLRIGFSAFVITYAHENRS
jgi:hypothetical protein